MRCSACGETDPALFHKGQRYCKSCRAVYNMLRKERAHTPRTTLTDEQRRAKQAAYMREYRKRKQHDTRGMGNAGDGDARRSSTSPHVDSDRDGTPPVQEVTHPLITQLEHLLRWKQQRE